MATYLLRIITTVALVMGLSAGGPDPDKHDSANDELIVCGWDEVFTLQFRGEGTPHKSWSWKAEGRTDLPAEFIPLFLYTDECKPIDGGRKVLITSSAGGVALVDRASGQVLFYGRAANAHSAALLPGDRIAVAASHDPAGHGDRLILFDADWPDRELWREELPWGHGVVWDAKRELLWALADHDLRIFRLRDWDSAAPKLDSVSTVRLPEGGGHDLYPVSGTSLMTVTTSRHVWLFDRDSRTFTLHPELSEKAGVKSISVHADTKRVVYVQAEGGNWWAERLRFLNPEDSVYTPGQHFYKARWSPREE